MSVLIKISSEELKIETFFVLFKVECFELLHKLLNYI